MDIQHFRVNPARKWTEDYIDIGLGRDDQADVEVILRVITRRGRMVAVFMTESERTALVRRLLRPGEWVMGLPEQPAQPERR